MMKLDNFIGMMTGHFDNKEQFSMMQAAQINRGLHIKSSCALHRELF